MVARYGRAIAAVAAAAALMVANVGAQTTVPLFSSMKPGQALPAPMREITLPKIKPNRVSLVDDQGTTVLKMDSAQSGSTVALPFNFDPALTPQLSWRWKVSRVIDKANMETKSGDDFAARVYVFFDLPLASLSFMERIKLRLARALSNVDVPTAALVYVWDNIHPIGTVQPSPYTRLVKVVVLQSGAEGVGKWLGEKRDVAADFRLAFGREAPRVTGIAVGNDTDQTGDAVSAWFGDFRFEANTAANIAPSIAPK